MASVLGAFTALMTVLVARVVVTPPRGRSEKTRIIAVDGLASSDARTVTLGRTADTELAGRYGLWVSLDSGHLKLGEIVSSTPTTITRMIDAVDFGLVDSGARGRFSGWYHLLPGELGFDWHDVEIDTPLGPAPAWVVPSPSQSGTWVVLVHGRGVKRSEGLRAVPVFRAAGFTSLLVSWRNDGDAPESTDRRYGLGGTEWIDVDAAIGYALAHGATDIVLMGWSMGGAIALHVAAASEYRAAIRGIVLESPVVGWAPTLDFQARQMRLPRPVRRGVLATLSGRRSHRLVGLRAPLDFAQLDFVRRAGELDLPILIMHSADDGYVPDSASAALAEARPDIVTFHRWSVARHAKLWNYDPSRFDREIAEWIVTLRLGG